MTEWYYSNGNQDRNGPIDDFALVELHRGGAIGPQTLVWREGMPTWRPWQDLLPEVALNVPGLVEPGAGAGLGRIEPTFATAGSDAPPEADGNPYSLGAPASPYAPPKARLEQSDVAGYVPGGPVVYAGFLKRFAAMVIDALVTYGLSMTIQLPMLLVGAGVSAGADAGGGAFATGAGLGIIALSYLIGMVVPVLYYSWMHASNSQATLGKMAVGIKVTRGDGRKISFWRAVGRYFAQILSALPLMIGYIIAGFTDRKQALHDMVCDTLVVDKWAFSENKNWQNEELGVVTIVILCLSALLLLGVFALIAFLIAVGSSGFGG